MTGMRLRVWPYRGFVPKNDNHLTKGTSACMKKILSKSRRASGALMKTVTTNRRTVSETNGPINAALLRKMDAWWRAANYLSVGQTYLYDNPLLREPLRKE